MSFTSWRFCWLSDRGAALSRCGFRASRRFNAFIEDVRYEFAICFSARDRHAHHSLQNFTERVIDLGRSRRRPLWPWKNQLSAGVEWAVAVLANLSAADCGRVG